MWKGVVVGSSSNGRLLEYPILLDFCEKIQECANGVHQAFLPAHKMPRDGATMRLAYGTI